MKSKTKIPSLAPGTKWINVGTGYMYEVISVQRETVYVKDGDVESRLLNRFILESDIADGNTLPLKE